VGNKLLNCKHGIHKLSCAYCNEMDDKTVIKEKEDALQHSWHSSSFLDNAADNSASGEQEYDKEQDLEADTADAE